MDRRSFLENVCKAGAGIVIGGSLIDLVNIPTIRATSRKGALDVREVPINLTDAPELKPVGGVYHLTVDDLEREILVVHSAPGKFIAVDIKCTHRGCDVNYDGAAKKFVCPCHGSEYDLTGLNLKGPSTKPLNYYHAEQKGEEVVVTVYGANDAATPRPAPESAPVDSTNKAVPIERLDSSQVDSARIDPHIHKKRD